MLRRSPEDSQMPLRSRILRSGMFSITMKTIKMSVFKPKVSLIVISWVIWSHFSTGLSQYQQIDCNSRTVCSSDLRHSLQHSSGNYLTIATKFLKIGSVVLDLCAAKNGHFLVINWTFWPVGYFSPGSRYAWKGNQRSLITAGKVRYRLVCTWWRPLNAQISGKSHENR